MIWMDDSFPYNNYKGKGQLFESYALTKYDEEITYQIDYSKELGMYRITRFRNNHWDGDLIFDEVEKNE